MFQQDHSLIDGGIELRVYIHPVFPMHILGHPGAEKRRFCNDPYISRGHGIRNGLGNGLSVNKLPFNGIIYPGMFHCLFRGHTVGSGPGVGHSDPFDLFFFQKRHTFGKVLLLQREESQGALCIDHRLCRCFPLFIQCFGILHVRREKKIERCPMAYLCRQFAAASEYHVHFGIRMQPVEFFYQRLDGITDIGCCGYTYLSRTQSGQNEQEC